jgi:Family of unknown function (DUF6463)
MDGHQRGSRGSRSPGRRYTRASDWPTPRTRELVDAGLVPALDGDPGREAILWFLALGLAFAALSELARWSVRATDHLPARRGEWRVGIGALIVLVEPASGGWLVLGIGGWTMWTVRRKAASGAQQPAQASGGGAMRSSVAGGAARRPCQLTSIQTPSATGRRRSPATVTSSQLKDMPASVRQARAISRSNDGYTIRCRSGLIASM